MRFLRWIINRVEVKGKAVETPIGFVPTADGLDLSGLNVDVQVMKQFLHVDREGYTKESESLCKYQKKLVVCFQVTRPPTWTSAVSRRSKLYLESLNQSGLLLCHVFHRKG
jgi:hypothetical protein